MEESPHPGWCFQVSSLRVEPGLENFQSIIPLRETKYEVGFGHVRIEPLCRPISIPLSNSRDRQDSNSLPVKDGPDKTAGVWMNRLVLILSMLIGEKILPWVPSYP